MKRNNTEKKKPENNTPRFRMEFLSPAQKIAWGAFQQFDILFLLGPAGCGKAQPLDSIVYTPKGPKRMGDITVGDVVSTPDGKTANVIGVFPQGKKQICRVVFKNGDSVEASEDHLWVVNSESSRGWKDKLVDTSYVMKNCRTPKGRRNLNINYSTPVYFESQDVPINPYILGLLLGDGSFSGGSLEITTADEDILNAINSNLNEGYYSYKKNHSEYGHIITTDKKEINYYISFLKSLGLWGCRSWEKTIPDLYLYNSSEIRWLLLQGLMDTDGTIEKGGYSYLCTTSLDLANKFKILVQSLGMECKIKEKVKKFKYKGKVKIGRLAFYCIVYCDNSEKLFNLKRKQCRSVAKTKYFIKKIIDRVELVGEKECQCILIDHPDHLYLTNNFIPTHNTHIAMAFAIHEILSRTRKKIVLTRPIVEAGESLGYLPGSAEEKVHPYMIPLYDCLGKLVGHSGPQHDMVASSIEVAPLALMRGRSFSDSICIFDEAQNATMMQLKLFLTRLDQNSKMIITGDPGQSDLGSASGLMDMLRTIESVEGIGMVKFDKGSIVRHPLVAKILEKLEE